MTDEYSVNDRLEYEDATNMAPTAMPATGWERHDDRYSNCAAVWTHENGDELLVYPEQDDG